VAGCAIGPHAAVVGIITFVAGVTGRRRAFVRHISVAGAAIDADVFTGQLECGLAVVEGRGLPGVGGMAPGTVTA
jgi:hypothetical protein